jgi:diguanylate cyclase (GGDEF)-like protein
MLLQAFRSEGIARQRTRDRGFVSKKLGTERGARGQNGDSVLNLERLSKITQDQGAAAADQSGSDADQTASDADQLASDLARELSARDQNAADRDQVASDRDQAVADRELEEHSGNGAQQAHDASQADRSAGSDERQATGQTRALAAEQRARLAASRDETAWHRDVTAQARDGAADRRDQESSKLERKMASRGSKLRVALEHASEIRARAATDRARAAEDRLQAARDRERAAEEREETLEELRRAHLDELTGAFRRGSGEDALQAEIDRARRGDASLVLAFIDVDALREVNNRDGHPAGDALLQGVVAAIRSKIRSYEPIVRFGGDEFVCAVSDVDLGQAEERFKQVQDSLAAGSGGAGVTVGLAEMRRDDTLGDLIDRADAALLQTRRARQPEAD